MDDLFPEYNEKKDYEWINQLHQLHKLRKSHNLYTIQDFNITEYKCSINKCSLKYFKDSLCRLHYKKKHNLLCKYENCNNTIKKDNYCYKHIKPLCCIVYCKCYAIPNELFCKKHNKNKIEYII